MSNDLAANGTFGSFSPEQLYAGEGKIVSGTNVFLAGVAYEKYRVLALNAANKLVLHDPTQTDSRKQAVAIAAQPIDATGGDVSGPIFQGGYFNHAALVWHASLTTLAQRKAAFEGTEIHVGQLYG